MPVSSSLGLRGLAFAVFTVCTVVLSTVSAAIGPGKTTWTCVQLQLTSLASGVSWKTENCTKGDPTVDPPLLTVNSIVVDLAVADARAVAAVASPASAQLQGIPTMAEQNDQYIAGINGGYFWRVDVDGIWVDDVCRGKIRAEAEANVSYLHPNFGVGDGLVKIDGEVKSNNCNCSGYSRPAVLVLDSADSYIEVLSRGETVKETVTNAIAAGPNLVSYNAVTGESYVDIPEDDDNINIYEHAANTAVGLVFGDDSNKRSASELILVTTDGSDECGPRDYTCGLNSNDLASLMKDYFGANMAMSMDQGGSTTMWVKGVNPDRNGVVSRSHNTEPVDEDGPRNVANGLFIELLSGSKKKRM